MPKELTKEMQKMVDMIDQARHKRECSVTLPYELKERNRYLSEFTDAVVYALQAVRKEAIGECISIIFSHTDGTTYADMAKEMDELLLPKEN